MIEDDVFIGPNGGMANDRFIADTRNVELELIQGVIIRRGATISVGAILLPGVEVGEQAVVAAGSLVSRGVPAHKIASGKPARVFNKIS